MAENDRNVYLQTLEQDEWNDLQAYHIESKLMWRNIAIIAIIALMIVAVYAMYLISQDKHKTIVFEKDSNENLIALGIASKTLNVDNKIIAHQLYNFVSALREVPLDVHLKRRNIDIVHKMIDPKIKNTIDNMLIQQYVKAKDKEIAITITNLKPLEGAKSWEVDWQESLLSPVGVVEATTSFSSIITFKRLDLVSPDIEIVNPIGLFITYVHPTEDLVTKGL